MEAAVEDGPGVDELPLEHVGVGVVEPHRLVPRGDEEVVAVVGEAEVGDPVGGRVRELLAATHGGWRGGGAHGGRWSRTRRRRNWARALGAGGGGIRNSNAQRARRARGRSLGERTV